MTPLKRSDLWSLEVYAGARPEFRRRVMAHKRDRQLSLGEHVRLLFEDRLTIHYQIQEMLRVERIFEAAAIQDELDAYNPLIPDGDNWKATMLIEYADVTERRLALARLIGIERSVWLRVGDGAPIRPIADEDLARETADKTSSVHFLRFQLAPEQLCALHDGAALHAGIDHPDYRVALVLVEGALRQALLDDLA
ncbi:DUF3501 family protein [Marinobacterium arenosum]|uniref:DUF3501 family protein n=1 Tax=Marinobacterium arenosum TaxID=2862496 RepID=UPI001C942AF6|nr:DUF3501 family protein [Marinobacterium arenosum]MBY4677347.1 DUF3501 family protein [Marinobacterium arenosum]